MMTLTVDARSDICSLNDQLRCEGRGGMVVVTSGLKALGANAIERVLESVASFDAFTSANDPYGEHDFGAVDVDGVVVFFKIDAYDCDLRYGSPDPADPSVTRRVLTVMLAEDY